VSTLRGESGPKTASAWRGWARSVWVRIGATLMVGWLRSRRVMVAAGVVAAGLLVSGGYAAAATTNRTYTGCLKSGSLYNVAIGSGPTAACTNATKVSWNQTGPRGSSAYEVWLAAGNTGSAQDFLNSLQGPAGADGSNGTDGTNGADGASAYQVWLDAGNTGTEQDFLNSLQGPPGPGGGFQPITYGLAGSSLVGAGESGVAKTGVCPPGDWPMLVAYHVYSSLTDTNWAVDDSRMFSDNAGQLGWSVEIQNNTADTLKVDLNAQCWGPAS